MAPELVIMIMCSLYDVTQWPSICVVVWVITFSTPYKLYMYISFMTDVIAKYCHHKLVGQK